MVGCSVEGIMDTTWQEQDGMPASIGFDGGYVDALTRTGQNVGLGQYVSTMEVWGWRTGGGITDEKVFDKQKVTYDNATGKWTYSPLKYWDVSSTYRFTACAPYVDQTKNPLSIDMATLFIDIDDISTRGVNLQDSATQAEKMVFNGTSDTDWMIARAGQTANGAARGEVHFTMQHILSKLNVRIKADASLLADQGIDSIKVCKLSISNFAANGNFTQTKASTPIPGTDAYDEWTTAVAMPRRMSLAGPADTVGVCDSWMYLQESLLIPQVLKETQFVTVVYTMDYSDGRTEKFTFNSNLKALFDSAGIDRLWAGYNYTLSFIINSEKITFDAGMSSWTDGNSVTEKVK